MKEDNKAIRRQALLQATLSTGSSLAGYYMAKKQGGEVIPYVLIGGLVGTCLGQLLID